MGDNLAADVHERMDQLVESVGGARKSNDKGRAIEVLIGEVKESHDAIEGHIRVILEYRYGQLGTIVPFTKHMLTSATSVDI